MIRTGVADPAGGNIQAQKPVWWRVAEAAQGIITDVSIQLAQVYGGNRTGREQWAYRLTATVCLTQAAQGFYAGDLSGCGIDEGLEKGERVSCEHGVLPAD